MLIAPLYYQEERGREGSGTAMNPGLQETRTGEGSGPAREAYEIGKRGAAAPPRAESDSERLLCSSVLLAVPFFSQFRYHRSSDLLVVPIPSVLFRESVPLGSRDAEGDPRRCRSGSSHSLSSSHDPFRAQAEHNESVRPAGVAKPWSAVGGRATSDRAGLHAGCSR